jgi:predicted DNA-binding transcriptional regulator AlpA
MTARQVAESTGLSVKTVYKQMRSGYWGRIFKTPKIVVLETDFLRKFSALQVKTTDIIFNELS